MNVLHFCKLPPNTFGGMERVVDQIAMSTSALGVKVNVLSLTREKKEFTYNVNGYSAYCVPKLFEIASTPFSAKIFKPFLNLAKNADIIHYHFPWPFADMVHFATGVNKPTVVTYHSDIVKQKIELQFYRPLMNAFLSDTDSIVATSENYAKTSPILSKFADKLSIIPIGIDKASYPMPTKERLNYWRHRFKQKFFLFIGTTRYYKGLHHLIAAAKALDASILIVGLNTGILNSQIPNVHFIGEVSEEDKVALLMLCYAVVLPSHLRSEAFGISLLEGAMFGKPMICCDIGTGTTSINIHQNTGFVVPPNDPLALQQAMQYLLDNPDKALEMGICAQKHYENYFTADKMAKSYIDIYQKL